MLRAIALFFSGLACPLLVPLFALVFSFQSGTLFSFVPRYTQYVSYLLALLGPVLIPALSLPVLKYLRLIDSYRLEDKHERVFPVLLTIISAFVVFYLTRSLPRAGIVLQFYLVMIILLSGFMVVTAFWKMSMHMTALGALCGWVFILGSKYAGDVWGILAGLVLASGCVGSSRIYLQAHTPAQVYAGFLYGVFLVIGILS